MIATRTFALLLVGTALFGATAFACNGQVDDPDPSGSTSSRSRAGQRDEDRSETVKENPPTGGTTTSTSGAPASSCKYDGSGSSSGGNGAGLFSCESANRYVCDSGEAVLTCSCSSQNGQWAPGTCSCNGITFEFDCAKGCGPGPEEYAKCNLPVPPDHGASGGGSSTSSTSSGG
ncbi:MAG: hypothetical protein KIT84_08235 [Labilithrix sp.]|nr:hypothetical protein [Labilithrix sp.]MCW5810985.1 hypothetical protein [Labilithrix sp.]